MAADTTRASSIARRVLDYASLPLNRSERLYLSLEEVAGSAAQVYSFRFAEPISGRVVRDALREVVDAHPRLRSCVVPALVGYRLRIRDDARTIDTLFDCAFREDEGVETDDESLARYVETLLCESFALGRDLPFKARFLPHPKKPALVLSAHHIAGDGRSILNWVRSLMKALNGQPLPEQKLDPSGHLPALLPTTVRGLSNTIRASIDAIRRPERLPGDPLRLPRTPIEGFAPAGVIFHRVETPLADLVRFARERQTTLGTMVVSASSLALRQIADASERGPVRARMPIDLRDLFPEGEKPGDGNYVSSFLVDMDPEGGFEAMLPRIDACVKTCVERFKSRWMMLDTALRELIGAAGRHQTARVVLDMKIEKHSLADHSFLCSNLGRVDGLDEGAIKLDAVLPSLAHIDLAVGSLGFRGQLQLALIYPKGEVASERVRAFAGNIDRILAEAVAGHVAQPARHAAA